MLTILIWSSTEKNLQKYITRKSFNILNSIFALKQTVDATKEQET